MNNEHLIYNLSQYFVSYALILVCVPAGGAIFARFRAGSWSGFRVVITECKGSEEETLYSIWLN